jgi:ribosomal protein S26
VDPSKKWPTTFAFAFTPGIFYPSAGSATEAKEKYVARKTILVCDNCSKEVPESRGAVMRLNYTDARRGSKQADLCDDCAAGMPGQQVARRGRRPKSVA